MPKPIIRRQLQSHVIEQLKAMPAVVLLGPRQVGKTTLAQAIGNEFKRHTQHETVYLDLERPSDLAKLKNAELYLNTQHDKLVILDEIQRLPDLFATLRSTIDAGIQAGRDNGQYLLLGSASMELQSQTAESLAGRVAYTELFGLTPSEVGQHLTLQQQWARGGFPRALLADTPRNSFTWRRDFIRSFLERDIPLFNPNATPQKLRDLCTMLAHNQGQLFNAAALGKALSITGPTVQSYTDLLISMFILRRLRAWHTNTKKRLIKSPKVYIRDSGLCHALLDLTDLDTALGHSIAGHSWEGFVIENLAAAGRLDERQLFFYRTTSGAEIDLVLRLNNGISWAIEIQYTTAPSVTRGFHSALDDLQPDKAFVVHAGEASFPLSTDIEAISLLDCMNRVAG